MKSLSPAARIFGFNVHAFAFVMTMLLLFVINLWIGSPYWALWVLLAWGVGVVSHWWFVLGPGRRSGTSDADMRSALSSHKHGDERED